MSESFEKAVEAASLAMLGRPTLSATTIRAALRAALPHLTAEDVPHVARVAWDEGLWAGATYHPSRRDFEDMRLDVEPVPPANPYAEEADHEHRT